jgi:hypothetical protein
MRNQREIAAELRVDPKTIQRMFEAPEFRREADRQRADWLDAMVAEAHAAVPEALQTLKDVMASGSPTSKVRAAVELLKFSHLYEADRRARDDLERRLAAVEEAAKRAGRITDPAAPVAIWEDA